MSLSVNQNTNINQAQYKSQSKQGQPCFYVNRVQTSDCCSFSKPKSQTFYDKVVSFAGKVSQNLSLSQIMKTITPQKPVNTLVVNDVATTQPIYFEKTQNGYIPSTAGFEEEFETSYVPKTTAAPTTEPDLTAAKRAIRNSFLAEDNANKKMKKGINPYLGKLF
ncbi:hypothetical protein IJ732_01160 [bacterium]|nr:hypothetical protein [bacterium]